VTMARGYQPAPPSIDGEDLFITGRTEDLLIVGGRNFYPQDVEAIAAACPHAIPGRAAAAGDTDPDLGTERVVVIVESAAAGAGPEGSAARAELAAAVRRRVLEELDCPVGEVGIRPPTWLHKTSSDKVARDSGASRQADAPPEHRPGSRSRHHPAFNARLAEVVPAPAPAAKPTPPPERRPALCVLGDLCG